MPQKTYCEWINTCMARLLPVVSVSNPDIKHPNGTHSKLIEPEKTMTMINNVIQTCGVKFDVLNHDIWVFVKENSWFGLLWFSLIAGITIVGKLFFDFKFWLEFPRKEKRYSLTLVSFRSLELFWFQLNYFFSNNWARLTEHDHVFHGHRKKLWQTAPKIADRSIRCTALDIATIKSWEMHLRLFRILYRHNTFLNTSAISYQLFIGDASNNIYWSFEWIFYTEIHVNLC